ncbi:MAG: DUF3006 domain-containing protein [Massiliimalia sp.]|jgi:hypothetical protein
MRQEWIVDRIEGEFVVLELFDKSHCREHKSQFPQNLREGDVVFLDDQGYHIDQEKTKNRREHMIKLQKKLFGK